MWDIYLGYARHIVYHWQLVLKHKANTDDTSFECTDACDGGTHDHPDVDERYFDLVNDDIVPLHPVHVCHATDDTGPFVYTYEQRRATDLTIELSPVLGTCSDGQFLAIVDGCARVAVPRGGNENCQDWFRWAMEQVVAKSATLRPDWKDAVEGIKEMEMTGAPQSDNG